MNLHEYQAKQLLPTMAYQPRWVMPVLPRRKRTKRPKNRCRPSVVKCQVHAGGRGKAGGLPSCPTAKTTSVPLPRTGSARIW
ncbi:ATP-grasp domain-containing protein [Escherichia coli]